jgi:excisionase family DNA binding protein
MRTTLEDANVEPLIDSEEAAKYLCFSPLTIRRMAHAGKIPSVAFPCGARGKFTHRFRVSDLAKYVASFSRNPQPKEEEK